MPDSLTPSPSSPFDLLALRSVEDQCCAHFRYCFPSPPLPCLCPHPSLLLVHTPVLIPPIPLPSIPVALAHTLRSSPAASPPCLCPHPPLLLLPTPVSPPATPTPCPCPQPLPLLPTAQHSSPAALPPAAAFSPWTSLFWKPTVTRSCTLTCGRT